MPRKRSAPPHPAQVGSGRYHVGRLLGEGSFGQVFDVTDVLSRRSYACKLEPLAARHGQLEYEERMYRYLRGRGVPEVHYFGKEGPFLAMVMSRYGPDLEEVRVRQGGVLPIPRVLAVGIKILGKLRHIHGKGVVHRDLKPQNMVLGLREQASDVFLIDYGLSKMFVSKSPDGRMTHTPYREQKRLTGTPRYASIHTQLGVEQSRRDDLESLVYCLVFLAKGRLPWMGQRGANKKEKNRKILRIKQQTMVRHLCAGLPPAFAAVLTDVRQLPFEAKPPYDRYERLLTQAYENLTQ